MKPSQRSHTLSKKLLLSPVVVAVVEAAEVEAVEGPDVAEIKIPAKIRIVLKLKPKRVLENGLQATPDGQDPDIRISRHFIRARSTGPGGKVVINVENPRLAHGKSLLHQSLRIEVLTSL